MPTLQKGPLFFIVAILGAMSLLSPGPSSDMDRISTGYVEAHRTVSDEDDEIITPDESSAPSGIEIDEIGDALMDEDIATEDVAF